MWVSHYTPAGVTVERAARQATGQALGGALPLVARQLQATFLPSGYPDTVAPGYLTYVSWQAIHHCASAVNGGGDCSCCLGVAGHSLPVPFSALPVPGLKACMLPDEPPLGDDLVCACTGAVLASTFLLYAVGLGEGAIPTAGALNWVLKDGLGQLGTLLFGR